MSKKIDETRNCRIGISVSPSELKLLNKMAKSEKESKTEIIVRSIKAYNMQLKSGQGTQELFGSADE